MTNELTTPANANDLNTIESIRVLAQSIFERLDVSLSTRKDYSSRISNFITFIFNNGGLTPESFLDYKRSLDNTKYEVSTKNKYLVTAKIFCKELLRKGYINFDPTSNVKAFKQTVKHKRTGVNECEAVKIFKSLKAKGDIKLKLVVGLLAFQGLRQIEVARLEIKDVDLKNNKLMVLGKGKDDKVSVDLHPQTVAILKEFFAIDTRKEGYLIIGDTSKVRYNTSMVSVRTLQRWVNVVFKELDIDKVVHGLRHYFITTMIENQDNLLDVAKFSRHTSLNMLTVYNDNIQMEKLLPKFHSAFSFEI